MGLILAMLFVIALFGGFSGRFGGYGYGHGGIGVLGAVVIFVFVLMLLGCAFRHIRSGVPTTYDQPFRSIRSPRDHAVGRGLVMAPWLGPVKCRGCRASGAARAAKRAP